jgi:hypothetical protein
VSNAVSVSCFENGRMIGKGKDYDTFAHLRLFPNMGRSYKYGILE